MKLFKSGLISLVRQPFIAEVGLAFVFSKVIPIEQYIEFYHKASKSCDYASQNLLA